MLVFMFVCSGRFYCVVVVSGELVWLISVIVFVFCVLKQWIGFIIFGFCLDCEMVMVSVLCICSGVWFSVISDIGSDVMMWFRCVMMRQV